MTIDDALPASVLATDDGWTSTASEILTDGCAMTDDCATSTACGVPATNIGCMTSAVYGMLVTNNGCATSAAYNMPATATDDCAKSMMQHKSKSENNGVVVVTHLGNIHELTQHAGGDEPTATTSEKETDGVVMPLTQQAPATMIDGVVPAMQSRRWWLIVHSRVEQLTAVSKSVDGVPQTATSERWSIDHLTALVTRSRE
jgi:hypothetical protein